MPNVNVTLVTGYLRGNNAYGMSTVMEINLGKFHF